MEESWVEIASRKHKELRAIAAANSVTSIQIPLTSIVEESLPKPSTAFEQKTSTVKIALADPAKDARSSLSERTKLRQIEGLDIQNQISCLIYRRKPKARPISPAKPEVGITTGVGQEDIDSSILFAPAALDIGISSMESMPVPVPMQEIQPQNEFPISATTQGIHPSRQSLLVTSPLQTQSLKNLHRQTESHITPSPTKIRINTETLKSKIQELRRASFASKSLTSTTSFIVPVLTPSKVQAKNPDRSQTLWMSPLPLMTPSYQD